MWFPNAGYRTAETCASSSLRISPVGRSNKNLLPPPGLSSTQIAPRCASTIVREIANPKPIKVEENLPTDFPAWGSIDVSSTAECCSSA